jgi:hypothetical protein
MTKKHKYLWRYGGLCIAFIMGMILLPIWGIPIMPAEAKVTFKPPKSPAPQRSAGGASRGNSCEFEANALTIKSLMPQTNVGYTIAERPAVFIYMPKSNAKQALFSIQDEENKEHYQKIMTLPGDKNGVIKVQIPNDAPGLKAGKTYKWSLVMMCLDELEPDSPSVTGWINRVDVDKSFANYKSVGDSLQLVSKLAEHGIWYDTLSSLAELRRSQPNNQNITSEWQDLLSSVGLQDIAREPIVN